MTRNVNFLAVFVASIAVYALGAVWYTAFSSQWLAGLGRTMEQMQASGGGPLPYVISFASNFVAVLVLAWIVSSTGAPSPTRGAGLGVVLAIGFVATNNAQQAAFEQRPLSLFFINTLYSVIGMALAGTILGAWPHKEHAAAAQPAP